MRAHISSEANRALALLYGLGEETSEGGALRALLRAMGIEAREITVPELSQTVGALAGLGGKTAKPFEGDAPDGAMLVFCGFSQGQLNGLLEAMRAAKVQVAYKAVLTAHNQKWSAAALLEELKQEHAAMERQSDVDGRRNGQ